MRMTRSKPAPQSCSYAPLPHEAVRTPKPGSATERRHPAPGKLQNSHQNRLPDRRIGTAVHTQRTKVALTRRNVCPKWDSNRAPGVADTGLLRKHAESGPVRPMYDPIRGPRCGHCPHPRFCLPKAFPRTAAPRTDRVRRFFAVNYPILRERSIRGRDRVVPALVTESRARRTTCTVSKLSIKPSPPLEPFIVRAADNCMTYSPGPPNRPGAIPTLETRRPYCADTGDHFRTAMGALHVKDAVAATTPADR